MSPESCPHANMKANAEVTHLEDCPDGKSICALTVTCADCGEPFVFVGLPAGMSIIRGAYGSADATEARLVMMPRMQVLDA
jgi:hypothetical protein